MVTGTDGVSWDHQLMSESTPEPGVRLRPLHADDAVVIGGWGSDPVFVAHAGWTPELPVEELFFLVLLSWSTMCLWCGGRRWARHRGETR